MQQIRNKVDCVAVYGRLCCRFWQQISNNLNSTACRSQQCRQLGRLFRPNVERPFDFVTSVYEAKATKSTVLSVEFNFVASVYRASELALPFGVTTPGDSILANSITVPPPLKR